MSSRLSVPNPPPLMFGDSSFALLGGSPEMSAFFRFKFEASEKGERAVEGEFVSDLHQTKERKVKRKEGETSWRGREREKKN
jgi:hypothetical protein